jgi:hypothetical protein
MPRRHRNRATVRCPRRVGHELADRVLERVAADDQRVDRAEIVDQRDLRAALAEIDLAQPRTVVRRPRRCAGVEAHVVAQQQLAHAMACAHQVPTDVLTRANEVAQRLLLRARDANGVQTVDHQQAQQPLRVTLIGLHTVRRRALDLARRRDHALHTNGLQRPRDREPRRAGLVCDACRPGQRGTERHDVARRARQPSHPKFARLTIHARGNHHRRMNVQPDPAANLCHVGTPMIAVGAQAAPGPSTRASHARVPTLTSRPDGRAAPSIWSRSAPAT